jgi:mannose-6-phosphate isomerase-like protein (cupin superfamily)
MPAHVAGIHVLHPGKSWMAGTSDAKTALRAWWPAMTNEGSEHGLMATERKWFIRNIAEVKWREFPDHHGGALSKPLVMPETAGSKHIDYRISMYQPMAYVKLHRHKTQEQVYHVIEGEGLMEIDGEKRLVRKHDFIFLPPGVDHSIENTGLVDLVFLVVTSPVTDG